MERHEGSWMISGRRTYIDKVVDALALPVVQNSDGSDVLCVSYYFYDYQIKANIDIDQIID